MSVKWDIKIDKPICFILFGHSLEELDIRIQEFKDLDVAWMSLNWWSIAEDVLKKIGEKLDYLIWYEGANGYPHPTAYTFKKSEARGCSLLEAIHQFCENNVKEVYLFGADGHIPEGKNKPYYGNHELVNHGYDRHAQDLEHFNSNYPSKEISDAGLQVYNTSAISQYNIPKITLDECLKRLKHRATTSLQTP